MGIIPISIKGQGKCSCQPELLLPARPAPRAPGGSAGSPAKEKGTISTSWGMKNCRKICFNVREMHSFKKFCWRFFRQSSSTQPQQEGSFPPSMFCSFFWFYVKFFWGKTFCFPSLYKPANWNPALSQNEQSNTFTGLQSYLLFASYLSILKTNTVLLQGFHL